MMIRNAVITALTLVLMAISAKGQAPPYRPNASCLSLLNSGPALQVGYYYGGHGGMDGSIAYAHNKRIRFYASYYRDMQEYSERTWLFNDLKEYITDSRYAEFGAGYRLGRVDSTNQIAEIFGGAGAGSLYQKEYFPSLADAPTELKGDFRKLFLQFNYGYETKDYLMAAGGRVIYLSLPRYLAVNYYNLGTTDTTEYKNVTFVNIEPAVQLGAGPRWLRIFVQAGISVCIKPYSASYTEELAEGVVFYTKESFRIGWPLFRLGLLSTIDLPFQGKANE